MDEKEGHTILFDLCRNDLDRIKGKDIEHDAQFSDTERYALQHAVQHMIEMDESGQKTSPCNVQDLVNTYVTDLELIYAKLCVNSMASSEDIFSVQKHIKPTLLSERSQSLLISLLKVLRKHSYLLRDHPHLWFQSVINEGSPELSSKATTIMENSFPSVPFMKYSDKKEEAGIVQARFYCSDTVACFDVSPEMDYMVCECRDGTIHMWSLETGNLEWSRPSLIKREFQCVHPQGDIISDEGAYREIDGILTFYRSVVFHPDGMYVLPGTLRSVYSLRGDCNVLYPNSACTFSHCLFPKDKGTILTDRFDNPKEVVLWSMESGQELRRIAWNDIITSFAISQDGSAIFFADVTGSIYVAEAKRQVQPLFKCDVACGMMHLTQDDEALVCGYLPYRIDDDLGYNQYGWVSYRNPAFLLCEFERDDLSRHDFILWPIEPKTQAGEYLFDDEGLLKGWRRNVDIVLSSLETGFYKWLKNGTALVGSPSFKYIAAIHVKSLSDFTREVVEEVIFSSEGNLIYSITSRCHNDSSVVVTLFRMSSQTILGKRFFTCPSLSLFPVKEGVVLSLKHEIPELWNFELTERIRQIPNLKGSEELIRLSEELIACEWYTRSLTPEELSGLSFSSVTEDPLELHVKDDSIEEKEALLDNSTDEETLDGSSMTVMSPYPRALVKRENSFLSLFLKIVNVISGECVSSIKTGAHCNSYALVSCNSQNQLLFYTTEDLDDDILVREQLTVSLRNNNSLFCVWKRKEERFDTRFFRPYFMFSPGEEFVVTWGSFTTGYGVHILDAKTGETKRTLLKDQDDIVDCKFVANFESLVCCSKDNFLRLFNIKSGDLLSMLDIEEQPHCLGACF